MKIGIVGSRRRTDKDTVFGLVMKLPIYAEIVSGGARGPDTWAVEAAKSRGMKTRVFRPHFTDRKDRFKVIEAYYRRNRQIAEYSDIIFALVAPDRKGGTEYTIKHARKKGKVVVEL